MKALIFDLETTGLLLPSSTPVDKQPKIIEIGALRIEGGTIAHEYSQLVDPGEKLEKKITKITGIKDADLENMPTFKDCVPHLQQLFDGIDTVITHNAPFDTGVLRAELTRNGIDEFPWPEQTVCTVQAYEPIFGYRPKLIQLYEHLIGEALDQTHRALDDVKALYRALSATDFFELIQDTAN